MNKAFLFSGAMLCALSACAQSADSKPWFPSALPRDRGGPVYVRTNETQISFPEVELLRVEAQKFDYNGENTVLFGRASVSIGNFKRPTFIQAERIEVETELTEVQVRLPGEYRGEVPWPDLLAALEKAPQSPRFKLIWGWNVLSGWSSSTLVYDRRTSRTAFINSVGMAGMQTITRRKIENGVNDTAIFERAAKTPPPPIP